MLVTGDRLWGFLFLRHRRFLNSLVRYPHRSQKANKGARPSTGSETNGPYSSGTGSGKTANWGDLLQSNNDYPAETENEADKLSVNKSCKKNLLFRPKIITFSWSSTIFCFVTVTLQALDY